MKIHCGKCGKIIKGVQILYKDEAFCSDKCIMESKGLYVDNSDRNKKIIEKVIIACAAIVSVFLVMIILYWIVRTICWIFN